MVDFDGGPTVIGCDDETDRERPVHEVELGPFALAARCVTAGDYLAFVLEAGDDFDEALCDFIDPCFLLRRGDGYRARPGCAGYPMIQVSFWGAAAYCNWLSDREARPRVYAPADRSCDLDRPGYRLPTEAEWEHACRLGTHEGRGAGPTPPRGAEAAAPVVAGFEAGRPAPAPAESMPADGAGLRGMLGNVREWCHDVYGAYDDRARPNPRGAARGAFRVVRGGSFLDDDDLLTPTRRMAAFEDTKCEVYGFRVARPR
jgi:formylglycine-generating enzyme required for sulfatase activity